MATDVDVQYFSHLNGLVLGNNVGDLINLLDTCLVNGIAFSSITSATIDDNGDINLTFFSAHNAMLFQVVELSGFSPVGLNGKYRIKGVPNVNQLILQANLVGTSITTVGTGKLASLGYEIVYTAQYKRVYRALNPTTQHPYIRVDETISDGTNSYNSAYSKYAMVGLIENMTHIDDYLDTGKLQLPLDTNDFAKNWKITGTGTTVTRGWSKWYFARAYTVWSTFQDSTSPFNGLRYFTLTGNKDAFYLLNSHAVTTTDYRKVLNGCGLFNSALNSSIIPNWFLMSALGLYNASYSFKAVVTTGGTPLAGDVEYSKFYACKYQPLTRLANHVAVRPILADYATGKSNIFGSSNVSAVQIPFFDTDGYARGSLKHVCYSGKNHGYGVTTPILSDTSMYILDSICTNPDGSTGGVYFYLGELT